MQDEKNTQDNDVQDASLKAMFLQNLISKRAEAISGRASSGIEIDWSEDEEHYQGIDDANRQYQNAWQMSQPKRWAETGQTAGNAPTRSVVFLNITRPYTDAASARISDMLMPTDDRAWILKPTPVPRLSMADVAMLGGPEKAREVIEETIAEAKQASEYMQTEIDDYLVESSFNGETRRAIEDAARLGSGVLKGPFPVRREYKVAQRGPDGVVSRVSVSEIRPSSKRIDPWNLFPDPACGDSIQNGSYTWEREYLSSRQIKEMILMPGYDREELVKALKEGPTPNSAKEAHEATHKRSEDQFEMWVFHGNCDSEQLKSMGVDYEGPDDKLPAMAVMINDRLVKVTLSAMDSGEFPYDILAWQARPGMPWGMGICRQIRTVQRILNGSVRAMMDNSGLSAAPQIILGNGVTPVDGKWNLHGGKMWRAEADANNGDARTAFSAFVVPSVQGEMMNIINWAMQMAEDVTGMPAMLQGIRGDAPNTLGGMQMQNNNATSVLRRLAKRFDDYVTRPHIRRYFDWVMQYSDDDSIKGDFEIEVRASSALVERDAQQQFMMSLLAASTNPEYKINPAKLASELIKGQRLDPKSIQYSEQEQAQMTQKSNPVDEAKAGLIAAQTDEVKAKTATKNVEGMFSATQAAVNIAQSPMLAPAADAMWKSAGGEDKDMAPAIPMIQGMEGIEPETNTNPLTPANPDSPLVGFRNGIEGG